MSDSRYEFHQQEVDSLKSAAIYTLAVCTNLKRMLEGIRDDQPRVASPGIHELLDPGYHWKTYVDKVDHLLAPVKIPVKVPIRTKMRRGSDGIHYEDMFPQVIELREEPIAHLAAWVIHDTVVSYLWKVWRRGYPGLVYCDALEATYDLVGPRWAEIRQELSGFVEYDYYSLRKAIENESRAAIERCRQTIVDAATHWNRLNVELSLDGGDGTFPVWLGPRLAPQPRTKPEKPQGQGKTTRETPNKKFDAAIQTIAQELFPEGQRRKTADIVLHIYQENESKTKNPEKNIEIAYSALWPKEIQNKPEGLVLASACEKIRASLNRTAALASKKR